MGGLAAVFASAVYHLRVARVDRQKARLAWAGRGNARLPCELPATAASGSRFASWSVLLVLLGAVGSPYGRGSDQTYRWWICRGAIGYAGEGDCYGGSGWGGVGGT